MDIHDIHSDNPTSGDELVTLNGMYKEYFLDYASYVILERAVPDIDDGLEACTKAYPSCHERNG
jgi:topoisomerase-4 subunit A